jgi:hypothetical protein
MGLKVFDLQCSNSHVFEGWFGSHEDYDSQQARGLVTCPMCQSDTIIKRLSAPRLNVGHFSASQIAAESSSHESSGESSSGCSNNTSRSPSNTLPSSTSHAALSAAAQQAQSLIAASPELAQIQAAVMVQMREFIRKTENVGDRFADEARKIHEGETDVRPIRGTATPEERESLAEDGIAVMALPDFLDTDRMQ